MKDRASGFTLVELLIVMAIIGVLTAIAVPNYQEALTRSKVAKFQGDAKACETAIESYYADHSFYAFSEGYPVKSTCGNQTGTGSNDTSNPGIGYLPRCLTTPAAYLGKLPNDPFRNLEDVGQCYPERRTYLYSADSENLIRFRMYYVSITYAYAQGQTTVSNQRPTNAVWMVSSTGPDGHRDQGPTSGGFPHSSYPTPYDPTNGINSMGDLFYFGPSIGFAD